MMKQNAQQLFDECMIRYPQLIICKNQILSAFHSLVKCYSQDGKVLVCGNGGSASDAEHIVGELMKKFKIKRPADSQIKERMEALGFDSADHITSRLERALPAISLVSQTSLVSAIINDVGGDMIFAQQVYGYGRPGDVLIALSTSGNSLNVINAIKVARSRGMTAIGFSNENGGQMRGLCDIMITVPNSITFQIQELHLPVYHLLCAMVEEEIFGA